MCLELQNTKEQHLEQFACFCGDNWQFSDKLIEVFGDHQDHYDVWKLDCHDARVKVEDLAFSELYEYDAEGLVENPIRVLEAFIDWQKFYKSLE